MAATPQDIKDFFGLIGKNVTNAQLLRMQAALATQRYGTDENGDPRTPVASDFVDWIFRQSAAFINRVTENEVKAAAVPDPEDLFD